MRIRMVFGFEEGRTVLVLYCAENYTLIDVLEHSCQNGGMMWRMLRERFRNE